METVAIGADHAGVALKDKLKEELVRKGFAVLDLGTNGDSSVDYPDYAQAVSQVIAQGEAQKGVLVCGSGTGMAIAANRHPGIRAAACLDAETARLARAHNDANVLCLGARLMNEDEARKCLDAFLDTEFEGGRHVRRVEKLGRRPE